MHETRSTQEKLRLLVKITLPLFITQLAMFMVTFFDVYMSSQYATNDLAGVSIGSSFWIPVYVGLVGILISITPIIAQLLGAERKQDVTATIQQGIYLSVAIGLGILAFFLFATDFLLGFMVLEPEVAKVTKGYLLAISAGAVPLFIFNALRAYMDALGETKIGMHIFLLSAPINILLNYLLIFGNWGFPELGGIGAGLASAITYWIVLAVALWITYARQPFKEYRVLHGWPRPSVARIKEMLTVGIPIGLSYFAETSIFSAVILFLGVYGTLTIAAHQIAINFTMLLYTVPVSLATSATILVGFEIGANRLMDARRYGRLTLTIGAAFSALSATLLFTLREPIAAIYSTDPAVIAITAQFLVFAALFQLSDAIQTIIQGVLTGYKDVNTNMVVTIIAYWGIGLPGGFLLATYTTLGAFGYWIGLVAGLTVGAIALFSRLRVVQRKAAGGLGVDETVPVVTENPQLAKEPFN